MSTLDQFNRGYLEAAVAESIAEVKANPASVDHRVLLADLCCFSGDYERADKQLEAVTKLAPGAVAVASLIRQLIRAEQWRQQFYTEGRVPEFLAKPDERAQLQLRASIALREGNPAEAAEALGQAEELRPTLSCRTDDGEEHEDLRDCDDRVAGMFEVFTSTGKYFWIPMETVRELEPRPIERPRDLLWRRVRMEVEDGPEGEVYLPSLYAPMPDTATDEIRLGRVVEYSEDEPVQGSGRRLFLLGSDAVSINDLPFLRFGPATT